MHKPFLLLLIAVPLLFSCVSSKKAAYFKDLKDSTVYNQIAVPEYIIQKGDLLSITVNSIDPEASKIFNLPNQNEVRTTTSGGNALEPAGYLVKNDGNIRFLMIGDIKVEGLTKEQLQSRVRSAIIDRKLLLDPVVEVRHLNFKVTVIGEVNRPTVISVPNEKITLLEALGLAGDMTIFGKRENVLVIRSEGGKRVASRLDLNSTQLFDSPYYFLRPNDIVYVEPNTARVMSSSRFNQLLPAIVSGLSVLVVVIDRLTR